MILVLLYSFLIGFEKATYNEYQERKAEHQMKIDAIIEKQERERRANDD